MANVVKVGAGGGKYHLLGVDWSDTKWGIPMWALGLGALYAGYRIFLKKKR